MPGKGPATIGDASRDGRCGVTETDSRGIVVGMTSTASSVIPDPAAERIAELKAALDPRSPDSFASYGAEAEAAVAQACTALARDDGARISQAARACLDQATSAASALNPGALTPRRGLAGLFDSRGRRLKRVREAFAGVDRQLAEAGGQLKSQAGALKARAVELDPAHDGVRQPIIDLGAWIEAGRQRLVDASPEAPEGETPPRDQLSARLEGLAASRMSALAHLPLARVLQNADAVAAERLDAAASAIEAWRADWRKGLGIEGKRSRKVQPEPSQLAGLTEQLTRSLGRAGQALNDGASRRSQAAGRLAALNRNLAPPSSGQ